MKKEDNNITKYGEFIPTFYSWIDLENQKETVKKLENISLKHTRNKNHNHFGKKS